MGEKPRRERLRDEIEDSFDEELELSADDDDVAALTGQMPAQTSERAFYFRELFRLQGELVKLQDWVVREKLKLVVIFEGRDAAGKGGVIKRITQRLNPRVCRVAALPAPNERERTQWYFQRYVPHLPAAGEIVLFDRSWYNRAGVERVMGFCTTAECEIFLQDVPIFEATLVRAGITLLKYWLDISKGEQKRRLKERRRSPLTQWKVSPIDDVALEHWNAYSRARDAMLARSHSLVAPWHIVRADDKRHARLNVIRDMLTRLDYRHKRRRAVIPDPKIVFPFSEEARAAGLLAE